MPAKKRIVHAQIQNPVLLRKTILETNILSIENLKVLKNIQQIKKRKDKLKIELRKLCKEMRDEVIIFEDLLPTKEEAGVQPEQETARELQLETKEEAKKRRKQQKLLEKTSHKKAPKFIEEVNPFEKKDELDFDIDKLKEKIKGL